MDGQVGGWVDGWMDIIILIVNLGSGRIYLLSKSMVFKYCKISKDSFPNNLRRLMEITKFKRKCSMGLESDVKRCVASLWFHSFLRFTTNVAQETVLLSRYSHQGQLHWCVNCELHRVLHFERPTNGLMFSYHCLRILWTRSPHFHFALGYANDAPGPGSYCQVISQRGTEKLSTVTNCLKTPQSWCNHLKKQIAS